MDLECKTPARSFFVSFCPQNTICYLLIVPEKLFFIFIWKFCLLGHWPSAWEFNILFDFSIWKYSLTQRTANVLRTCIMWLERNNDWQMICFYLCQKSCLTKETCTKTAFIILLMYLFIHFQLDCFLRNVSRGTMHYFQIWHHQGSETCMIFGSLTLLLSTGNMKI